MTIGFAHTENERTVTAMADYIDRDAAIAALDDFRLNQTVSKYATVMQCKAARDAISRATKVLESLPAPDVEPVKHGRWNGDTCTSCNLPWNYNMTQNAQDWGYFDPMPDYCHNCGAKMNEEGK